MLRSLDTKLFLYGNERNETNNLKQKSYMNSGSLTVVRITKDTTINAAEYCKNKYFIIDSGVTLSFNTQVICENTRFQFINDDDAGHIPGKIIFHKDVCGTYNTSGDGVIIKYTLPLVEAELLPDALVDEVPIVGHNEDAY